MISPDSITDKSSNVEQELGDILAFLNPPQQQYDVLADRAWRLLFEMPPGPSIERALAVYFELFAHGYVKWQGSYSYPRIHEYFFGAYLQAIQDGGSCLSPQFRAMLEQMTNAFIAYTWCENALICNDPKGLLDFATRATECGTAALDLLDDLSLGPLLRPPIEQYLQMNVHLWTGFKLCAEMYLAPLRNEIIADATLSDVKGLLKSLEDTSRELASELRAHFSFAQRFAQAHAHRNSDLRVKEGTLLLRANGYVGEELITKLFKQFANTNTVAESMRQAMCKETGLPIVAVRRAYMPGFFETILGQEYLDQIILELSTDKHALTFSIRDGERERVYPVEKFKVRLARFGTISVEFEICIEDASVSHVRVLESLMAPHAGRFDFVWRDAPSDIERGSTNYVDCFLRSQEWIKSIRQAMNNELSLTAAEMESVLEKWQEALCELASFLPREFTEPSNASSEQAEQLDSIYQTLHEKYFLRIRKLAWQWIKESSTSSSLEELVQEGKRLFPPGVRFEQLMDIAEEVLERIKRYFSPEEDGDIRHLFSFDRSTGWATVLLCNSLIIDERDGRKIEPFTESDYYRVVTHSEFKGFIIQSREARSGIDDWLFVATPAYRNLATIRSHETDAMYIGGNSAFLYLPDDPQFLTWQYVETALLLVDIRTLVLSFNRSAKEQIKQLEKLFKDVSKTYKIAGMSMSKSSDYLLSQRDQIEDFRTHAEKILDLLRACTISRYQDHSELLKEMIKESRVDDIRNSLEHNIADLDRFHAYLTERLKRRMDDRTVTTQKRISYMVVILTLLSALSIVTLFVDPTALRAFFRSLPARTISFVELLGGMIGRNILLFFIAVLLVAVLLGSIIAGLIIRKRSRRNES
jgi:hypothetical protein